MKTSGSNQRSTISVRLQDKLAGANNSVRSSMTDGNGQVTLKVKNKKRVMSRSGQKSPTNNNRYEEREYARRQEEQEKEMSLIKENLLAESGDRLDIDSRFQLQEQPSRISIVSRQSNTDMKGANLVKYDRRAVPESEHEESPDRQTDMNMVNNVEDDDIVHQDTNLTNEEVKQPDAI